MTSEKYFLKWIKEAGRGHIAAFLTWGSLLSYTLITAVQLTMSTEYNYFGTGSRGLLGICGGLGAALSFLEFFYLMQPRKLDFYYSLPVKKSTVFWGRYVHGLLHFLIPLCAAMAVCGVLEGSLDGEFFPFAASYTGQSILAFTAVFLLFYHTGILMITICGNILPAVLGYGVCLVYGHVLIGNVFTPWAENSFRTYCRIPLFEKLDVILAPVSLAGQLTGIDLFDKREVFAYVPPGLYIAAVFGWIVIVFLLFAMAQKRRKAERVGKIFVLPLAERMMQFLLSFLVGAWCGCFVTELSGLAPGHPAAGAAVNALTGGASAAAVHFLIEWGVGGGVRSASKAGHKEQEVSPGTVQPETAHSSQTHALHEGLFHKGIFRKGIFRFRRKWQLIGACAASALTGFVFFGGASAFDSLIPEEGETESISVSINGLDMGYGNYIGAWYNTDQQLEKYRLAEEGKHAAWVWIHSLVEKKNFGAGQKGGMAEKDPMPSAAYTHGVICYHMKNGKQIYRLYPLDAEDFRAFSAVYETKEYKKIAYPVPEGREVADARFIWSDGITDRALKLTGEEKETIIDAYRKDMDTMKMEDLTEALPLGFVEIDSEVRRLSEEMPVYPFFSQTCRLLETYGVPIHRTLADYPVRSVTVKRAASPDQKPLYRNQISPAIYEEPKDIEKWIQKSVPERFDRQPLLYPLDYTQEIRAEVTDEATNSITNIYCYGLAEF